MPGAGHRVHHHRTGPFGPFLAVTRPRVRGPGQRHELAVHIGDRQRLEARIDRDGSPPSVAPSVGVGRAVRHAIGEVVGGEPMLFDEVGEALRNHAGALVEVRRRLAHPRAA